MALVFREEAKMGIIQTIMAALGLSVPKLAPGDETIAVTALFISNEVMSRVSVKKGEWLVEHTLEAVLTREPTARYPLGVRVDSTGGGLIGWVMPSEQNFVREVFATLETRHGRPVTRIKMDCVLTGESEGRDFAITGVDLLYRSALDEV